MVAAKAGKPVAAGMAMIEVGNLEFSGQAATEETRAWYTLERIMAFLDEIAGPFRRCLGEWLPKRVTANKPLITPIGR